MVREFVGHGIGEKLHEEPQIPNYGQPGRGPKLAEGMVLAIEPMVAMGRPETKVLAMAGRRSRATAAWRRTSSTRWRSAPGGPLMLTAHGAAPARCRAASDRPAGGGWPQGRAGMVLRVLPRALYRVGDRQAGTR